MANNDHLNVKLPVFMPGNNRNWEQVDGAAVITEEGDLYVRLSQEESKAALIDMAERGVLWQVSFDYRMPTDEMEKINKQFQQEYYDDETLVKVHLALHEAGVKNPTEAIGALQNAGILFRERK